MYTILCILIFLTSAFAYANHRWLKWPPTIGIMALSLICSLLLAVFGHFVPVLHSKAITVIASIDFEKVLMRIMLSFLLFAGAMHIDYNKLKSEAWPIMVLSTLGVFISTLLISILSFYLFGIFGLNVPYIYCLLFGALISPTDPIAVMGILKRAGIPSTLELKITGESLFNDGVAVVVFITIAEAAAGGIAHVSVWNIIFLFLREGIGGLAFGALLGYVGYLVLRSVDDYRVEVMITIAMVMCGYAVADYVHTSGPLAMIVAGIILGNKIKRTAMSAVTWDYVGKFWELLDEIFNAILFLLIGFEMLVIRVNSLLIMIGLIMIAIALFARWISVLFPVLLLRFKIKFEQNAVAILTWGGLRGGLSVALALSLPASPYSDGFIAITYIIVIFSIIVQGLTIGKVAKMATS